MSQPAQYPQKRKSRKVLVLFIVAIVAACAFGGIILSITRGASETASAVSLPTATQTGVAPAKTSTAKTISNGEWVVGEDVDAGRYRTPGAKPGALTICVWELRADGEPDGEILTVGTVNGEEEPGRVTLKSGQFFKTSGCKDWVKRK